MNGGRDRESGRGRSRPRSLAASPPAARRRRTAPLGRSRSSSTWRSTSTSTPTTPASTRRSSAATSSAPGSTVTPRVPSDPSAPIKEVAAGRADLAISYEPEVLLAREQGLDVVAVAALVDEPLTSLISLPAGGIAEPADLRGKTIATAGIPYQADYLETILAGAGLSASRRQPGRRRPQPAARAARRPGRRDPRRLPQHRGGGPRRCAASRPPVVPVNQLGVPTYDELVLVAELASVDDDPEALRLFIAAPRQGHPATRSPIPQAATAAILAAGDGPRPGADPRRDRRHPAPARQDARRALRPDGAPRSGTCSPAGWPTTA